MDLNACKSRIYDGTGHQDKLGCVTITCDRLNLKILTYKQILKRLPIALARGKAVNTSEVLLNENRQIERNKKYKSK